MLNTIWTIALNDTRLRSRRWSTGISLLAIIVMTWLVIPDPAGGMALISVDNTRLLYTSQTIALGSVTFAALFIGLVGVYLARGQSQREIYNGVGALLASLPVSTSALVVGRWLGAFIYLVSLCTAFLFTVLILHGIRGEGSLEFGIYFSVCFGILLPVCAFAASMAALCDAIPALHRRTGDFAYLLFWGVQFSIIGELIDSPGASEYLLMIDGNGLTTMLWRLQQLLGVHISVGLSDFDVSKEPILFTTPFWTMSLVKWRVIAFFIMCLPLLPAIWLFHRYDPAKVRQKRGQVQKSWWRYLNQVVNPIARCAGRLLPYTAPLPAPLRNAVSEILLTIILHPVLLVFLLANWILQSVQSDSIEMARLGALACSIVLIADIAARHREAGVDKLRFAISHLRERGMWIEWSAAFVIVLLFMLPALLQFIATSALQTGALLAAVIILASAATILGQLTRSGKSFTFSFLFLKYIVVNAGSIVLLDFAGVRGNINLPALVVHIAIAVTLFLAVEGVQRWYRQND